MLSASGDPAGLASWRKSVTGVAVRYDYLSCTRDRKSGTLTLATSSAANPSSAAADQDTATARGVPDSRHLDTAACRTVAGL
jgi:hypothetical protein